MPAVVNPPSVITVKVAGALRSASISGLSLTMRANQRWTGQLRLESLDGLYRPGVGQLIEAFEDGSRMFLGSIDQITEEKIVGGPYSNPGTRKIWLTCLVVDLAARLDSLYVTWSYPVGTAYGAIVLDIMSTRATYGAGAGFEKIQYAAAGSGGFVEAGAATTEIISFDHIAISAALDLLASKASKVWYVDTDGNLHFQDRVAVAAPFSLTNTSYNYTSIRVITNRADYVNTSSTQLTNMASPAFTYGQTFPTFHGDGVTRSWALPASQGIGKVMQVIWTLVSGTAPVGFGNPGSNSFTVGLTGSGSQFTYDIGGTVLTQDPAEMVVPSNIDISVLFLPLGADWVEEQNSTEISARQTVEGNSGIYWRAFSDSTPIGFGSSTTDAIARAIAALVPQSRIPTTITVGIDGNVAKPRPGMLVTVAVNLPQVSGTFLVQDTTATYQSGIGFRYSCLMIDGTRVPNWIDFFKQAFGTGSIFTNNSSGSTTIVTGAGGPAPAAPNVTAAWLTNITAKYALVGGDWTVSSVSGTITPPGGTDCSHLKYIRVIKSGPGSDTRRSDITVAGPFTAAVAVNFNIESNDILGASSTYGLEFDCANEDDAVTQPPYTTTVSVTIATIGALAVAEAANLRVADAQRGLTTNGIHVDVTLLNNPGGSGGVQEVTIWTLYDWGDGRGVVTTWKGWYPVTGNVLNAVPLDGDNTVWVTTLATATFTVKAAIGRVNKPDPIPGTASSASFTFLGPTIPPSAGSWINSANFTGLAFPQLRYFSRGGIYSYMFGNLAYTATFSSHPSLKSTRCFVQNGKWNGASWAPDPADNLDHPFVDAQITSDDANTTITVNGDSVTIIPKWPWEMSISTYAYPDNRIHIDALGTDGSSVTQAAFAGQTSPCSEIIFSSDGQYAYIQPSISKALASAVPWDTATLGNRLVLSSNKLQVTPSLAPDLISATAVPSFSLWANASALTFAGVITVDDGNTNWGNTAVIIAVAYGPSALNGQEIARLAAPFTVSAHHVNWTGEAGTFLQAVSSESWSVVFTAYDALGWAAPNPITATATVNPSTVATVVISELTPRYQDTNQGILTRLSAVTTMGNSGQVPQNVTYWLSRDGGTTKVNQGWTKVTSSPQTITLPYPKELTPSGLPAGYYVPASANETWILYAAAGAFTDALPPGTAATSNSLTVVKIADPSANGVTGATASAALPIIDGLNLPDWKIPTVSWTDPDITHSGNANYDISAAFTVLTFQCTDSAGNPAPGAAAGANLDQGGDEVEVGQFPVLGAALQSSNAIDSYGFNPSGSIYTYACLRIYTCNKLAINSFKDVAGNAVRQSCWAGAANRILINFGSVPNAGALPAAPFAPNVTLPTPPAAAVVNFAIAGGLPVWYLTGSMTLPSPFTAIKKIHITAVGLDQIVEIPAAQFGNAQFPLAGLVLSYTTSDLPRDTVTIGYTVQFWVENSDGVLTASPPGQAISVAGTAAPFASTAPLAPAISAAATPTVTFTRDGHQFDFALSGIAGTSSFTAPSNPGGGAYRVRVTKISPTGVRNIIDELPGPFTPATTTNTGWAGNFADIVPSSSQTWKIGYLPINADNIAATELQVNVTIAPNVVFSVTGAEGVQFVEGGTGAKSHVVLTPTFTTSNAPGFANGPQTYTAYFSADNGNTWFGLDWVDASSSGIAQTFEVWRPTVSSLTQCKVAAVIGALAWLPGTFQGNSNATLGPISNASLVAAGAVQSGIFTLSAVGAPSSTSCTSAVVNVRTATGPAIYNGVTLGANGGIPYWSIANGFQCQNPALGTDANFFYSAFHCYVVQANTPGPGLGEVIAPPEQEGIGENHTGALTGFGAINLVTDVNGWPFNPAGSTFTQLRIVCLAFSRSLQSTVENCWPGTPSSGVAGPNSGIIYHGTYCDVTFGPQPSVSIIASLSSANAGSGILISSSVINVKTPGAAANLASNPGFESGLTGWTSQFAAPTLNSTDQQTGSFCCQLNPGQYCDQLISYSSPSTIVTVTGPAKSVTANGTVSLFLRFLDASQNIISQAVPVNLSPTGGSYVGMSNNGTAPSGVAFIALGWLNNSSSGYWVVDNVSVTASTSTTAGGLTFDGSGNLIINANSEFKFVGGQLQIQGVDFTKGFNGFAVGSASIPQITISPGGVPMGWIGSDSASGFSGAWFKRVLIGGTSPANAQFFADASGNVTIAGSLIVGSVANATNAQNAAVYTGTLAVANIVGWGLASINISGGVTFAGNNYSVRINNGSITGFGAAAIDSNGPVVIRGGTGGGFYVLDPNNLQECLLLLQGGRNVGQYGCRLLLNQAGGQTAITVDTFGNTLTMVTTEHGSSFFQIQDTAGTLRLTSQHIFRNGIQIL